MENDLKKALYTGTVKLGNTSLECHVLESNERIFTSRDFLHAFGLKFEPKEEKKVAKLFIEKMRIVSIYENNDVKDFIEKPIKFKKGNFIAYGYPADLLPKICDAILALSERKMLPLNIEMKDAAKQSRKLLNSLANVGLVALIDEATGYQNYRDKNALQDILEKYLEKEFSVWAKRFPDEFYIQLFRLKNWEWKGMKINRPGIVGTYTKNIIYSRLAPGILKELETRNPITETGKSKTSSILNC